MSQNAALFTLKFATFALMIAGGLIVVMASHPATDLLPNLFFDLVFLPFDGEEKATQPAARLLAALAGGGFVGFGVTFWMIITKLLPREPELAKTIMISGLVGWFIVDCAGSFASGAWFNVVLNCVILASFLFPLRFVGRGSSAKTGSIKPSAE